MVFCCPTLICLFVFTAALSRTLELHCFFCGQPYIKCANHIILLLFENDFIFCLLLLLLKYIFLVTFLGLHFGYVGVMHFDFVPFPLFLCIYI
jgi:hypothetical protein